MKWFKFEPHEEEITETESSSMLVYLSPEALKHAVIVDDFASFQDSPDCIPGGRLFEVIRQYSYRLRQVADLVEEPLNDQEINLKNQPYNSHPPHLTVLNVDVKNIEEALKRSLEAVNSFKSFEGLPFAFSDLNDF